MTEQEGARIKKRRVYREQITRRATHAVWGSLRTTNWGPRRPMHSRPNFLVYCMPRLKTSPFTGRLSLWSPSSPTTKASYSRFYALIHLFRSFVLSFLPLLLLPANVFKFVRSWRVFSMYVMYVCIVNVCVQWNYHAVH